MKNRNYVIHVNRESLCSSVERGKECYKHINSTVERIYSRKHEETKQNKTREQKMNINSSNSNNNKRRLVEKSQFFFSTNQLSTYNRVKKQHHISCARLFFLVCITGLQSWNRTLAIIFTLKIRRSEIKRDENRTYFKQEHRN